MALLSYKKPIYIHLILYKKLGFLYSNNGNSHSPHFRITGVAGHACTVENGGSSWGRMQRCH